MTPDSRALHAVATVPIPVRRLRTAAAIVGLAGMMPEITSETVCAPSDDVVAREIEGEIIIVPLVAGIGDADDELYTLNETGHAIWAQPRRRADAGRGRRRAALQEFDAPAARDRGRRARLRRRDGPARDPGRQGLGRDDRAPAPSLSRAASRSPHSTSGACWPIATARTYRVAGHLHVPDGPRRATCCASARAPPRSSRVGDIAVCRTAELPVRPSRHRRRRARRTRVRGHAARPLARGRRRTDVRRRPLGVVVGVERDGRARAAPAGGAYAGLGAAVPRRCVCALRGGAAARARGDSARRWRACSGARRRMRRAARRCVRAPRPALLVHGARRR